MKQIAIYLIFVLFITILIPIVLIQGTDTQTEQGKLEENIEKIEEIKTIPIYNVKTKKVEEMELEEYVKGVVAAEMPAAFHIEALKAQAIAARTYAIHHVEKYKNGNPAHPNAPLCTGIHCQAWLSEDELLKAHSAEWMEKYWPKIGKAVDETKGQIIMYGDDVIEPLYHSTSGGKTENSEEVFSTAFPYLRSVESPYEEDAPKFISTTRISIDEFIKRIKKQYKSINLTKENLKDKIQLVEKSEGGRINKLRIDTEIVSGRDIRTMFNLNSTDFKITVLSDGKNIEIETHGYGHGVGMSQWGANGMAENGSTYEEILKHYYTGINIQKITK